MGAAKRTTCPASPGKFIPGVSKTTDLRIDFSTLNLTS
jgi:hypothetical protein